MLEKLLHSREQYKGHFVRHDFRYSFPVGAAYDRWYQVVQPILHKDSPIARPEIFDALIDYNPAYLLEILGISFENSRKLANEESIARFKDAYEGKTTYMPSTAHHLLSGLVSLESTNRTLQFVSGAFTTDVELGDSGEITHVQLDEMYPYFLYYFITPHARGVENSFEWYVEQELIFGNVSSAEDIARSDMVERINIQVFNTLRNYVGSTRAMTGNLSGFPPLGKLFL